MSNYRWKEWESLSPHYQNISIELNRKEKFLFLTGIESVEYNRKLLTTQKAFPSDFLKIFTSIEQYQIHSNEDIHQWLFNRKIAFDTEVFITSDVQLTLKTKWKEVVKQTHALEDIYSNYFIVVDQTQQWAFYYHHHDLYEFYHF